MRTYTGCLTWRQYAISDKTSRPLEGQFLVIYSIGFDRELNFLAVQQSSESKASYKTPREAEFFVFKRGNCTKVFKCRQKIFLEEIKKLETQAFYKEEFFANTVIARLLALKSANCFSAVRLAMTEFFCDRFNKLKSRKILTMKNHKSLKTSQIDFNAFSRIARGVAQLIR